MSLFEDSFFGTAGTALEAHMPTLLADNSANTSGWTWSKVGTTEMLLTGAPGARIASFPISPPPYDTIYQTNVASPTLASAWEAWADINIQSLDGGRAGFVFNWTGSANAYFCGIDNAFSPAQVDLDVIDDSGGTVARKLTVAPGTPITTGIYTVHLTASSSSGNPLFSLYFGLKGGTLSLLSTFTDTSPPASAGNFGLLGYATNSNYATNGLQIAGTHLNLILTPPTPGTATLGGVTATTITASATAASGTTGPYTNQWYASTVSGFTPGAGNIIAGATGLNLTWAPPDHQLYFIACQQTDSQSTPQTAITNQLAASAPLATLPTLYYGNSTATIKILAIGDSIFHNVPSDGSETPIQRLVDKLATYLPNATISATNAAVSGTTTTLWAQAGSTYMSAAISAGVSAGSTDAVVMLGTNDSAIGGAISAATYAANLQSIASQLFAGISTLQRVWFNNPPYTIPGADAGNWTPQTCDLQRQYGIAIGGIVNGTTLLQGATDSLKYTADHPEETLDEIHPNAVGATSYGIRDAYPMLKYFSPPTLGRRATIGFGMALALGVD
jgi:hypothetical protein